MAEDKPRRNAPNAIEDIRTLLRTIPVGQDAALRVAIAFRLEVNEREGEVLGEMPRERIQHASGIDRDRTFDGAMAAVQTLGLFEVERQYGKYSNGKGSRIYQRGAAYRMTRDTWPEPRPAKNDKPVAGASRQGQDATLSVSPSDKNDETAVGVAKRQGQVLSPALGDSDHSLALGDSDHSPALGDSDYKEEAKLEAKLEAKGAPPPVAAATSPPPSVETSGARSIGESEAVDDVASRQPHPQFREPPAPPSRVAGATNSSRVGDATAMSKGTHDELARRTLNGAAPDLVAKLAVQLGWMANLHRVEELIGEAIDETTQSRLPGDLAGRIEVAVEDFIRKRVSGRGAENKFKAFVRSVRPGDADDAARAARAKHEAAKTPEQLADEMIIGGRLPTHMRDEYIRQMRINQRNAART